MAAVVITEDHLETLEELGVLGIEQDGVLVLVFKDTETARQHGRNLVAVKDGCTIYGIADVESGILKDVMKEVRDAVSSAQAVEPLDFAIEVERLKRDLADDPEGLGGELEKLMLRALRSRGYSAGVDSILKAKRY